MLGVPSHRQPDSRPHKSAYPSPETPCSAPTLLTSRCCFPTSPACAPRLSSPSPRPRLLPIAASTASTSISPRSRPPATKLGAPATAQWPASMVTPPTSTLQPATRPPYPAARSTQRADRALSRPTTTPQPPPERSYRRLAQSDARQRWCGGRPELSTLRRERRKLGSKRRNAARPGVHLWTVMQITRRPPAVAGANGHAALRLANTTSITFAGVEAEALLLLLDQAGICASAGSACLADSDEPSHVIRAMKPQSAAARQKIRFSLGTQTTVA